MKLFKKHSILAITISKVDGHRKIFDEERIPPNKGMNKHGYIYVCTC